MIRRTLHRAAPLALACLALSAGGAEAKIPKSFFGVEANPGGLLTQSDSNRMRSARRRDAPRDLQLGARRADPGIGA